jgi:aminomethyltransferase
MADHTENSSALKRTVLYPAHLRLGAKMVDFGGWEMPLHYGSQIEEHRRVRSGAGMFDVSHMLALDVAGAGARDFLRRVLANDIDRLIQPGKALYSCMLNDDGGVLDDLIAYRLQQGFRLVVNAATAEADLAWLQRQRAAAASEVEIAARRDLAIIAVQGPQARAKTWLAWPASQRATEALKPFHAAELDGNTIARTGYTGEDGFEIMLPAASAQHLWDELLSRGVAPAGLAARDTLRLEAGMNLYGQDMDATVTPLEAGLAWTVDLKSERNFIGRAALLRRAHEREMRGLLLLDKGVLRAHQSVETAHGPGVITSGSFAPTLQASIALARLPRAVVPGDEVHVSVRDKRLRAKVVGYPFVRHGKALI